MGVQLRAEMLSSNFCKLTKKKKKNAATRKKKAMKAVGSVGKEHTDSLLENHWSFGKSQILA